jgi:hypothetical protein
VKLDLMVKMPMRVIIATHAPVFFKFASTVNKVFVEAVFVNHVIGVKEALAPHRKVK